MSTIVFKVDNPVKFQNRLGISFSRSKLIEHGIRLCQNRSTALISQKLKSDRESEKS